MLLWPLLFRVSCTRVRAAVFKTICMVRVDVKDGEGKGSLANDCKDGSSRGHVGCVYMYECM